MKRLRQQIKLMLLGFVTSITAGLGHAAITVVDDANNTITLQRPAQRIVSMSPHVTELLFAAGAGKHIVGAVSYSDYPEEAKKILRIGDNRQIDVEKVISLRPDLIVLWVHGSSLRQVDQLKSLGIPLFYSEPKKLVDIPNSLVRLGKLLGTEKIAQQTAAELQHDLDALSQRYANRSPVTVFYQVWDKPLYTLNGKHIVSDAIRLCGGVNIFDRMALTAPSVGIESVLQENPETIIGTAEKSPSDGGVQMWRRYPTMTAVKRDNLFTVDGNLMNRAGPRMIAGTATLCEKLELARQHRKALP
jgi:iron complex transport system substrate-binding protein